MHPHPASARIALSLAAFAASAVLPPAAAAQALPEEFSVSGTVLLATDYISRGQSFTGGKPFILGSLDLAHDSGAYAGLYGGNVDFGDDESNSEFGFYAGWAGEVQGFSLDTNAYYYIYPGVPEEFEYDYLEFGATIRRTLGAFTPRLRANWSPDYFGGRGDEFYLRGGLRYDVPQLDGLALDSWVGHQFGDTAVPQFVDWGASISYAIPDVGRVQLLWSDADLSGVGDRLTLGIGRTF